MGAERTSVCVIPGYLRFAPMQPVRHSAPSPDPGSLGTLVPGFKPHRPEDLLSLIPRGSTFPLLYDPAASAMIVQTESVRVIHFTPNFWPKENHRRDVLLSMVLLPVPLSFFFQRYVSQHTYLFPHWQQRR